MSLATMDTEKARFNMIQQQIRPWNILDPVVLELLSVQKREMFVPDEFKALAFADIEIPLAATDDTSKVMLQPKIEARLLQELSLKDTDKVLEIGTGSGYLAALMASAADYVYAVEIDPALVEMARQNLKKAGVSNACVDLGDGSQGWSLYAPYDAIVLSGSLPELPKSLLNSLKIGGRLVGVVGTAPMMSLQLVTRTGDDAFSTVDVVETVVAPLVNAAPHKTFSF